MADLIFNVITAVLGAGGFGLGLYNIWYARREPLRQTQRTLRTTLKKTLQLMDQHHVAPALKGARSKQPFAGNLGDEMEGLEGFLKQRRSDFIAPEEEDMDRLIDKVHKVAKLARMHVDPELTGLASQGRVNRLQDLQAEMHHFITAITKIDKGQTIRMKAQFKRLDQPVLSPDREVSL